MSDKPLSLGRSTGQGEQLPHSGCTPNRERTILMASAFQWQQPWIVKDYQDQTDLTYEITLEKTKMKLC